MNWPNRLSLLRVAMIPLIVLCLYLNTTAARWIALILFMLASFTDWLDGWMARKYDIVTNFGKFIDPVADKLLVLSTMVALCGTGELPAWACIVVLFRDLAVDGLRMVAVEQGRVIAAGKVGKLKTTTQMLTLVVFLVTPLFGWRYTAAEICMYVAIVLTIWSAVEYFVRNGDVLKGGTTK